jgi:hypothetical protein
MGLGATVAVAVLVVAVSWAAFWGALAANVGMSRGAPPGLGARWGVLLGPVGLAVVMARTRGGGRRFDERLTAGKQLAGRYRTKAVSSAHAWREAGAESGTGGSAPRPAHVEVPPPTWGPPAALPPSSEPVAPVWGAPSSEPVAPAALPRSSEPVAPVWSTPTSEPVAPVWGAPSVSPDPPAGGDAPAGPGGPPRPF